MYAPPQDAIVTANADELIERSSPKSGELGATGAVAEDQVCT